METWQLLLGGLLTVVGSALAARIAGRSSVEVAQVSARVDQQTVKIDQQRADTERFQAVHAADAQRIVELAAEVAGLKAAVIAAQQRADTTAGQAREREDWWRNREDEWREYAAEHVAFDWRALILAQKHGEDIGQPPPLVPRMIA